MTWDEHDTDPIQVAVEQYLYWRGKGYRLEEMMEAINGEGSHGKPESMTGDEMIYWLARVWDGELV
ncbi:MAG: hypothetical protein ACR2RF_24935 [Geminicoccaceae bacterium]